MASNTEILLALRAPTAGWLSVLTCVIDEANCDPAFDDHQRELVMQMLNGVSLPPALVDVARQRAARFEAELDNETQRLADEAADDFPAVARPKLTLVGNATA